MITKSVKKRSDITLAGVSVDLEMTDGRITGIVLTDRTGSPERPPAKLMIREGSYSGLQILVPAAPPMVKRYRIQGELRGLKYDEMHETRRAAAERLTVIMDAGYIGEESDAIVEVEVPDEEA